MDCKPRTMICVQTYQSPTSTEANGTEQNRHIERHGAETKELPLLAQGGAGTDRDPFARVAIARGRLRLKVAFQLQKLSMYYCSFQLLHEISIQPLLSLEYGLVLCRVAGWRLWLFCCSCSGIKW